MNISDIPQFRRNAKRFEEIVWTLSKYGLAYFVEEFDSSFVKKLFSSFGGGEVSDLSKETDAVRVRLALTELGTTFIKLGQMLSTRPDLVDPEILAELEKLQSHAPSDPIEDVESLIEEELGRPPSELFATFEKEAMASASIAQVHRATLSGGVEVVVKVQHTEIEKKIVNDLEILISLAEIAEKHSSDFHVYQPVKTLSEFRNNLLRELDFGMELQNLEQFRSNFEEDDTVCFPCPYPERSSRRVLTMQRLDGLHVQDRDELERAGIDVTEVASRGAETFVEMIFRDRFYHADPHPGNILVMEDNVIGLLDCGMIGHLDNVTRERFEGMIEGFMTRDVELLTDHCLHLGKAPPDLDRERLEIDLDVFVSDHLSGSIKDINLGRALNELMNIIRDHRIVQRPGIQKLLKVLIMLEGTGRHLDPDFSLSEILEPVRRRALERKFSVRSFFQRAMRSYNDWESLLRAFPRDAADIMKRVRQGTLDVHLEHRKLDAVVNRLTYGVLTAALFLGSALLWSQQIPPRLFGASIPGFLGSLLAVWLGFRLFVAIYRSGGLD